MEAKTKLDCKNKMLFCKRHDPMNLKTMKICLTIVIPKAKIYERYENLPLSKDAPVSINAL